MSSGPSSSSSFSSFSSEKTRRMHQRARLSAKSCCAACAALASFTCHSSYSSSSIFAYSISFLLLSFSSSSFVRAGLTLRRYRMVRPSTPSPPCRRGGLPTGTAAATQPTVTTGSCGPDTSARGAGRIPAALAVVCPRGGFVRLGPSTLRSGAVLGCSQGHPDAELLVAASSSQASSPPLLRCGGAPARPPSDMATTSATTKEDAPRDKGALVLVVVVVVGMGGEGGWRRGGGGAGPTSLLFVSARGQPCS